MSADLEQDAAEAVEIARQSGVADCVGNRDSKPRRGVRVPRRQLEKVKDTTSQGLALRIYVDGRYSSHSTTDLNPDRLRDFVREAVAITRALEPDEYREITPSRAVRRTGRPRNSTSWTRRSRPWTAISAWPWCAALDAAARDHERVISATAGVYDGSVWTASASSNGFSGTQQSTYCWLGSEVTLRDQGDKRAADSFYAGGAHVTDLPDAASVGSEALERALVRLESRKGPTRKAAMVVDARAAGSLIDRLLRPANARSVQQGQSFWASRARPAGIQQGTRDRRRPADPARPRIPAFRRRGHLGTRHPDRRNGHDPQPVRRHLLRAQRRTDADDGRALEPAGDARQPVAHRAARSGRRRHLRHLLARRQCGQYDGRFLARVCAAISSRTAASVRRSVR